MRYAMKCFLLFLYALLLFMNCNQVFASDSTVVRGMNYDPLHSFDYIRAVGLNDTEGMKNAIKKDFDKLAELQNYNHGEFKSIRHIKTFYTLYSALDPQYFVNIADVVHEWNQSHLDNPIILALGVYQFRRVYDACELDKICIDWTQKQVEAAIAAVNKYNTPNSTLIDRIVVGNESIHTDDPHNSIRKRLLQDIAHIQKQTNHKVLVGTAQFADILPEVLSHSSSLNKQIFETADFLGSNVYPFWAQVPYHNKGTDVKKSISNYWENIASLNDSTHNPKNKEFIATEEGWPALDGTNNGLEHLHDYFYYWFYREQNSKTVNVSYYFSLFDKLDEGVEGTWGLFGNDRSLDLANFGTKIDKTSQKGHLRINFENMTYDQIQLFGCTEDVNIETGDQGKCFPIYGVAGSGLIDPYQTKNYYIDSTGDTYKSLLVIYQSQFRLCFINQNSLSYFNENNTVYLKWFNDSGDMDCTAY